MGAESLANALNGPGPHEHLEPRVQFWKNQTLWPQDAGGFIFAARALLIAGRQLVQQWQDDAPHTSYDRELPKTLWLSTPVHEIQRGVNILRRSNTAYRQRVGPGGLFSRFDESEFPTTAEWAEAVAISDSCRAQNWERLLPFFRVSLALEKACLQGKLLSAARPFAGGLIVEQDWHFWNYEHAWMRFDLCRVNLSEPDRYVTADEKAHWLFFQEASLRSYLREPPSSEDVAASQVPKEPRSPKQRRGRRAQYDWRLMAMFFRELIDRGEINSGMSSSAIADRLLSEFAERWEDLPDKRSVEDKVAEWRFAAFPEAN